MADVTYREGLGRPLTYEEADDNFRFVGEQADIAHAAAIAASNSAGEASDTVNGLDFELDNISTQLRNIKYGNGPYPSLDLLFTGAGIIDPRIVFERATPATYWDEMGILRTAGPNEPRIDYDPATGECRGLLVEGQGTNLFGWSNSFSVGNSSLAPSIPDIKSPNGQNSRGLTLNGINALYASQGASMPILSVDEGGAIDICHSLWIYRKANFDMRINFVSRLDYSGNSVYATTIFDPKTLTFTSYQTSTGFSQTNQGVFDVTDDWVRAWAKVRVERFPGTESSSTSFQIYKGGSQRWDASGERADLFGYQAETGTTPTSYIPTEGSQVTRAADNVSIPTSEFPYNPNEGTIFVEYEASMWRGVAATCAIDFRLDSNNRASIFRSNSSGTSSDYLELRSDGVPVYVGAGKPIEPSESYVKAAISYKNGEVRFFRDGQLVGAANSDVFHLVTRVGIGCSAIGGGQLYGSVGRHTYYPRALSDAELIALTQP